MSVSNSLVSASSDIEKLAHDVMLHRTLYYRGQAIISDEVYDQMEGRLRELAPNHPVLGLVGAPPAAGGVKVRHEPPMLSLNKTYDVADLPGFAGQRGLVMSLKIDGVSLSVEYDASGLVRASTRGNGDEGEDVTDKARLVPSIPKRLTDTPEEFRAIFGHDTARVEVRGELYFSVSAFDDYVNDPHNADEDLDAPRNAVAGILGRVDIADAARACRVLSFSACEIMRATSNGHMRRDVERQYSRSLEMLAALGFDTPEAYVLARVSSDVWSADRIGERGPGPASIGPADLGTLFNAFFDVGGRDVLFDGIVGRINDTVEWEDLGATSSHPRGSIAFKRVGETAETVILDVIQSVGRTGKVSLTAKLAPVRLSGAQIESATLHNPAFIESHGLGIGARVQIVRSGEVIPKVLSKLADGSQGPYAVPTSCLCGAPLRREGPQLYCTADAAMCGQRGHEGLIYFLKALEIKGLADKTVAKMRELGLVTRPGDFFRLTKESVMTLPGFQDRSAANIVAAVAERRRVPLATFLTALGIPLTGPSRCEELADRFKTLQKIRSLTPADFQDFKGWGGRTAEAVVSGIVARTSLIDDLCQVMEVEDVKERDPGGAGLTLAGQTICITGSLSVPRKEWEKRIAAAGGKVSGSVSAKTSFLVCNEASGSSKYQDAQKLGIPILTEADLAARLGGG